jgi:uncharacterized protein YjbJ (UPF0337 family)
MNWARIERKWERFAGQAKSEWTKFTDDDLKLVAGKKELLIGKVQEHYGVLKQDAERQVDGWFVKVSARHAEQSAKNGAAH